MLEPGTAGAKYFTDIFTTPVLFPNTHTAPRESFFCDKIFLSKATAGTIAVRMYQDLGEQFQYIPLFDDAKQILWRVNWKQQTTTSRSDHEKVKELLDTAPEEAGILPG